MFIKRKMARDPIKKHSDLRLMTLIDKGAEIFGCTIATRRCKKTKCLIAPRAIKGELGDRHELNMGETKRAYIAN